MSAKFLAMRGGRMLIIPATDSLDDKLVIGQMQGQFQLCIVDSGHCVHEDRPEVVAEALWEFWKRNGGGVIKRFPIPPIKQAQQ